MSQRNLNNDSAISVASLHATRKTEAGEPGARPEPVPVLYQPGSSSAAPDHAANEYLTSQQPAVPAPPLDSNQPQPSSHTGAEEELGSHITSPLTHPNGVAIFPSLSTTEQDQLSRDALQQAQHVIIADIEPPNDDTESQSDGDHTDGGYESLSEESSSTSLASSVRDFMFENGRRYHRFREGTYNFPNDEVEQEREDMKHAMMKLLCSQKLHFAPIGENPQRILDIGTGTGIWAIEVGDQFPSAEVLGVDLSPIQPSWIPPNVRFVVDDVESPWLYPRDHFDYIHSRHTVMAIKNWPRLLRRSLEHLKPGGWMEMQEIHHSPLSGHSTGVVPPDNPVAQYWSLINAGLSALGVDFHAAAGSKLSNMMREAGFINVTERVLHVPLGTWPKNKVLKAVGLYWRTILVDGLQAIALGPLTRGLKWDRNRIEMLLMNVRRAYMDDSALIYMRLHLVYGQKA
ncbi:unnamed protein product [Clonostachys rosea f. rosea IK726]|uniref:Uncharacterized protein n=1 Tax=Clonostachys rosea f. rosea IK726 TaxID=1349383 RepID=A0ACA9TIM9_BIOOC|nr:unnamed protein product [Clonostachys rosea f. rosea IK726]